MKIDAILPKERIDAMTAAGFWAGRIITDHMDDAVAAVPDKIAVTDTNSMTGRATSLSYRQLRRISDRIALGMVALGVEPGDVVSFQLPNWWEVSALYLACVRIGAVANPLMPIFRHREITYMLEFGESRLAVIPRQFRDFDYLQMMTELRRELPALKAILVVGGVGEEGIESVMLNRRWEDEMDGEAIFKERRPGPNDVTQLGYTSGTTGEPKGVMHTANTLLCGVERVIEHFALTGKDVVFMASPLAHQTGFLYGMVLPLVMKSKSVLLDQWDPVAAARCIQDEGVTLTVASTPFLADLTYNPEVERYDTSSFRMFLCGGAPVPSVLAKTATEKLRIRAISVWGMSENGIVTATRLDDPPEKVFNTDGAPLPGMAVRVVDAENNLVPDGVEGRLQAKSPTNFVGYLKKPELYGMDNEGWFETGDLARRDEDGYIRITGRSKDIIIRGGENIPVVEVEALLFEHPAVQDVAIVAMPDERLGERACAFVVLNGGSELSFREMIDFLVGKKLARSYFPEHLELLQEMPRNPTGKVQKFKLREMALEFGPGGAVADRL